MGRLVSLLAVSLPGVLLAACGGMEPPHLDSPGSTIVCLGDSITAGVGAGTGPVYPQRLGELLGTEVINAGVPGDTTAQGLARLDDALAHDPWLVIVELGGNDLLRRVPLERTEADLRQIVERLLAARVAPLLIEIEAPLAGGYDDLFDRLEEDYGVPVLEDVLPEILSDRSLKSDLIHPNGAGYERLAQAVAEVVEPWLESREEMR